MSAIESVKAHYVKSSQRHLYVAEWDLDFYASPMTLAEEDKIRKAVNHKNGSASDIVAYTFIEKLKDKDGNNIFSLADKETIKKCADAKVVAKVSMWLSGSVDPEEHEKN